MDPCIVDYSVETPTRCSYVIEFIIPRFFFLNAQHVSSGTPLIIRSSKLYLQPLVYMPIWWKAIAKAEWEMDFPLSLGNGRSPHGPINQRLQIEFRASDDERCAARNMLSFQKLWNNKLLLQSCILLVFLLSNRRCKYSWVSKIIFCAQQPEPFFLQRPNFHTTFSTVVIQHKFYFAMFIPHRDNVMLMKVHMIQM